MIDRTLGATVEDNITKRGILACCNAGHTLPAMPDNNTQTAGAHARMRRKGGQPGRAELQLSAPAVLLQNCRKKHGSPRSSEDGMAQCVAAATPIQAVSTQKPPIPMFHKVKYHRG